MMGRQKLSIFMPTLRFLVLSAVIPSILALAFISTHPLSTFAAGQEIKFTGTALQSVFDVGAVWWYVQIDQVSFGPHPCANPIFVLVGGGIPSPGYVDPNINVGDKVEVYGVQEWDVEVEYCYVQLLQAHHYIMKISGSGENQPPVADFTWKPATPRAGETIQFIDRSHDPDGTIVEWNWYRPPTQGIASRSQNPSWSYETGGDYEVLLRVLDDDGAEGWKSRRITVIAGENQPPIARLSTSPAPAIVRVNENVTFDASGSYDPDGEVDSYFFVFGDDINSGWISSSRVTHRYSRVGIFGAIARVADNYGAISDWTEPTSLADGVIIVTEGEITLRGQITHQNDIVVDVVSIVEGPHPPCGEVGIVRVLANGESVNPAPELRIGEWVEVKGLYLTYEGECVVILTKPEPQHYIKKTDGQKPDLTITETTWVPTHPAEDDAITVNVRVKNQGSKGAGSFYTALYADGIYLEKKYLSRLTAGATATIAFTGAASKWSWMKQCDKNHTFKAIADYDRKVDESNENNNEFSKTIRIACTEEPPGSFTGLSFSATCTPDGKIRCGLHYNNQLGGKSQILFIFRKQATGEVVAHEVVEVDQGTGTAEVYFDCPSNNLGVYQVSWKAYKKCDTTSPLPFDCPLWSCAHILAQATLRAAAVQYDSNGDGKISDSEKQQAFNDYFKYALITKDELCAATVFNFHNCQPVAWSEPTEEQEVVCPCGGTFTGLEFTANCLESGPYANHIDCTLSYQNDLGEEALVVFVFKKASTGKIIGKARPYANEGSGQAGALFECPSGEPGTYRLSWEVYRASDIHEQNPVARCEPGDELNIGCPCGSADIPETTVVLDSPTQQVMTDVTADEVHFSTSTPLLDRLEIGDIIVCGVTDKTPYGMLRNVEGISRSYDVTLETTQAKLVDAVNIGSVSVSQQLKQSDVVSTSTAPGVQMRLHPQAQVGQLKYYLDAVLYEGYGGTVTTTGDLTISLEFFFDLSIGWGGIKYISFRTEVTEEADLEVKAGVSVDTGYSKELYRGYFAPITVPIGPVPVVLVPVLTVNVSVTGEVTAGITARVEQEATFETELRYDNGDWSTTRHHDIDFEHDDPEYSQACDMTGSFGPELGLLLYGVVGPYVNIEGYLEFEADFYPEVTWKLWGGLNVNGGVKFDALGYAIEHEEKLFGIRDLLAQADQPTDQTPPWIHIDEGPMDGETLNDKDVTFRWSGWDNVTDSDDLEFSYWLENYDNWSGCEGCTKKRYTGLQDKEYTFHLKAEDEAGNVSEEEVDFSIATSSSADEDPPTVSIISHPGSEVVSGESVTFRWSAEDNFTEASDLKMWYKLEDWDSDWVSTSKTKKTYKHLSKGSYTFRVRAKDEAENVGEKTWPFEVITEPTEQIAGSFEQVDVIAKAGKVTAAKCRVQNTGTATGRFEVEMFVYIGSSQAPCKSNSKYKFLTSGQEYSFQGGKTIAVAGLPEDATSYDVRLVLRDKNSGEELDEWGRETVPVTGPGMTAFATGPVDLVLVDPDGATIDRDTAAEHGVVYSEADVDGDGVPDLKVEIPERELGDYEVTIVPDPEARSYETYSVTVIVEGEEIILAEEVPIKDALETPYTFESSPTKRSFWLQPGLNFVSVGIAPERASPRAAFDELAGALEISAWSSDSKTWLTLENRTLRSIDPLCGYYLWAIDDLEIGIEGLPPSGEQLLRLPSAGWQQIGVPYEVAWGLEVGGSITLEHASVKKSLADAVAAGWISGTISQWDSWDKRWIESTIADGLTLDPWAGYWIYTFVDNLTLHFSETPAQEAKSQALRALRAGREPKSDLPGQEGGSQTDSFVEAQSHDIRVVNAPNPVRETHTTTFMVRGICQCEVQGLQIEIYDLSGKLVWQDRTSASTLPWHTEDSLGHHLANGMYIYRALVKIDGEWIPTPIEKLAILR